MGITLDNSIIDFNVINNIVNTLQTHQDTFQAFESQYILTTTDTNGNSTSLPVTSLKMAAVKVSGKVGDSIPVNYGVNFTAPPIVVATVEYNSTSTAMIAQMLSAGTTNGSTTTYSGGTVKVTDALKSTNTSTVTVHIFAIGQSS
jgi:hypothetical protein